MPWAVEAGIAAVFSHFFLNFPWDFAFLLGAIIAAVSPAVVVPCLFRLRSKGYGVAKGIPTLIIAVASIDDATSVAIFGIIKSIMFSNDSLTYQILQVSINHNVIPIYPTSHIYFPGPHFYHRWPRFRSPLGNHL